MFGSESLSGALALVSLLVQAVSARPSIDINGRPGLVELQRPFFGAVDPVPETQDLNLHQERTPTKVKVIAGVMSKCPDAHYCELTLDRVLDRINSKVNLHLTYIGTPNSTATWNATCKHGDSECAGNVHQLCVADALRPARAGPDFDLSPSAAQLKWFDIISCMNYAKAQIGQESLIKDCLTTVKGGPTWDGPNGISKCVNGKRGRQLLLDSIAETNKLDIVNSCTIIIDGGATCVRDDNVWKRCTVPSGYDVGDFVAEIERQYVRLNEGK